MRIAEGYSDGLRADSRRSILQATLSARREAPAPWSLSRNLWPQMAVAASMIVALALPALLSREGGRPESSPINDLQVGTQAGKVVLTWRDGGQPRKIVRATSRRDLARLGELPVQMVTGERWVDDVPVSEEEPIVFYFVE